MWKMISLYRFDVVWQCGNFHLMTEGENMKEGICNHESFLWIKKQELLSPHHTKSSLVTVLSVCLMSRLYWLCLLSVWFCVCVCLQLTLATYIQKSANLMISVVFTAKKKIKSSIYIRWAIIGFSPGSQLVFIPLSTLQLRCKAMQSRR